MTKFVKAINWNRLEDSLDKDVWDKVWANTWIDTKIPLSGDIETWETMTEEEKTATKKVLGGLTLLDTVQSEIGVPAIIPHALTPHEAAVLTQFTSMECFTGDHELLTPNGWVPIESVKKGDLIAQFHPETETVDFAPVVETSKHYAEETYEIKKVDMLALEYRVTIGFYILKKLKVFVKMSSILQRIL